MQTQGLQKKKIIERKEAHKRETDRQKESSEGKKKK